MSDEKAITTPQFKTTAVDALGLDALHLKRVQQSWPLEAYELTGDEILQTKKRLALQGYAMRGIISNACRLAGVSRQTWYNWIKDDEAFAQAATDGKELAIEALEEMANDRGFVVSDALLTFMLKHGKPQVFRDRVEHSGPNGQPLPSSLTNVNVCPVLILPDNHRADAPAIVPAIPTPPVVETPDAPV